MRLLPWLVRIGLFTVGFGIGVTHFVSDKPPRPVIIELQILLPDGEYTDRAKPVAFPPAIRVVRDWKNQDGPTFN